MITGEQLETRHSAAGRGSSAHNLLICLLLTLFTLAVYWPVRGFDFGNYDDPVYVIEARLRLYESRQPHRGQ